MPVKKKVNGRALEEAHRKLIRRMGGHVTWSEFAHKTGVSLNTLTNLRKGHTTGSVEVVDKIVQGLGKEGVTITREELLEEITE